MSATTASSTALDANCAPDALVCAVMCVMNAANARRDSDGRGRDKLERHSLWLERESSSSVDEVDGSGERTTTPSGSLIRARSTSTSRHPTSAVRPTRASLAREKRAEETTRASGAARTAAAAPLVLSGEALRRATERLHAGAGSASPRRSAAYVDEECTFTPKIGALSRRMAAEQRRRRMGETNGGAKKKNTKTTNTTPKEPVGLGDADEAKTQSVAETAPKPVVAEKKNTKTDAMDEDLSKECTFKPRIGRRSRALSEALLKKASMPSSFVERSKIWADRKEHILEAEREAKLEDEVRDCTFHPQQVTTTAAAATQRVAEDEPNSPPANPVEISGLDAYLARQERARRLREEKNAILNRFDGASWTPELTVPKEFEFHSSVKTRASSESTTSPAHEQQGGGVSAWRSPAYVEARAKLRLLHGSTTRAAAAAAYGVAAE